MKNKISKWHGAELHNSLERTTLLAALLLLGAVFIFSGCGRGRTSEKTPIHLNPNMDNQEKYKSQSESRFYADGATMRPLVPGTVARGQLRDDAAYYTGKDESGNYADNPKTITTLLLNRGRERFDIYCSPCHGRVGDGRGIMVKHEYIPPPSFHQDRIRDMKDGNLFEIVSGGIRNMPSYAHQISVDDRWAIIAYLRALQRSQNASVDDIPADRRLEVQRLGSVMR